MDQELSSRAARIRADVSEDMARIRNIIGINLKDPEILINTKSGNPGMPIGARAYFVFMNKKIYFSGNLPEDMYRTVVRHELIHYVRDSITKSRFPVPVALGGNRLSRPVGEGVSDFIALYLDDSVKKVSDVVIELAKYRYFWDISKMYEAIRKEAKYPTKDLDHIEEYFKARISKPYLSNLPKAYHIYDSGAMISLLLLAANNFDVQATAIEMLKSSNEALLQHLFSAVAHDTGNIADFASRITALQSQLTTARRA